MGPCVTITIFPQIRCSGISFSYYLAYAICGGLAPIVVAWQCSVWIAGNAGALWSRKLSLLPTLGELIVLSSLPLLEDSTDKFEEIIAVVACWRFTDVATFLSSPCTISMGQARRSSLMRRRSACAGALPDGDRRAWESELEG